MQSVNKKVISVLLTRPPDRVSSLLRLAIRCKYSHAAIGIEEFNDRFFSFNAQKGGFAVERPLKSRNPKKRTATCLLYYLEVSEEAYTNIKNRLQEFDECTLCYSYSYIGVVCCILGVAHRRKHSYFCSQFVSELISSSGAAQLQKQPPLYLPKDFMKDPQFKLCFQGTLQELEAFINERNDKRQNVKYRNIFPTTHCLATG